MNLPPRMARYTVPFLALLIPAFGQMRENIDPNLTCEAKWRGDGERFCEVRESRMPASQRLDIAASPNGGVAVRGWNRSEILVRARIEAQAPTISEAKSLAAQIQIQAATGRVSATGPGRLNAKEAWASVSYEIFVPHRIDLQANSSNGGITIQDVEGDIAYATVNGGVTLTRLAGHVHGETKNGGVNVEMAGERWQGAGLEARTTNGGVSLHLPLNYSARILASTQNGGLRSEFPVPDRDGAEGRNLDFTVGAGGAPIRISTRNGGVSIRKKAI